MDIDKILNPDKALEADAENLSPSERTKQELERIAYSAPTDGSRLKALELLAKYFPEYGGKNDEEERKRPTEVTIKFVDAPKQVTDGNEYRNTDSEEARKPIPS